MSTTPTEPTTAAPAAEPKPVEAPKPAPPTEPRTFTQAELDQIIQKRLRVPGSVPLGSPRWR